MTFGENLRQLRLQRHFTQQRVANDMNISQASVTAYETGYREPSFEIVRRFADYFHVAPSVLMPFGDASDDEEMMRIAEAIKANDKLLFLFHEVKNMNDEDLGAVISVAVALSKKYGD